jgi:radical SAM protein with 4Fe4S-binding SPASM domain
MGEIRSGGGEKANLMANLIEGVKNNPLVRIILHFLTKRDKNGRRIERILMDYAGLETPLNLGDRFACLLLRIFMDWMIDSLGQAKDKVKAYLRIGYWRKGLSSVLEGIAWRGVEKPFTASVPFLIVWNFTNACNLRCKHCYQRAEGPTPDELSTEEALLAVDLMAAAGVAYIAFSGGEPLLRGDFFEVAERVGEWDMGFSVATNGTLLTKEVVNRLEKLGCEFIQVSLDGLRETHNRFRGIDCFDRVLRGIRNAVESKIAVGVSTCITRYNLHEVESIIELAEKLGADIFMHYNFIPTGRGREIMELDIPPEERERLLNFLASKIDDRRISLLSTAPQYARVCMGYGYVAMTHFDTFGQQLGKAEEIGFLAQFIGGCGAGRLYMALQPNGDLAPCVFIPIRIGNILLDDLLEVWRSSETLNLIRDRRSLKGYCGICPWREICGGCRARAYSYLGDLQESDPGCPMNMDRWKIVESRFRGKELETRLHAHQSSLHQRAQLLG